MSVETQLEQRIDIAPLHLEALGNRYAENLPPINIVEIEGRFPGTKNFGETSCRPNPAFLPFVLRNSAGHRVDGLTPRRDLHRIPEAERDPNEQTYGHSPVHYPEVALRTITVAGSQTERFGFFVSSGWAWWAVELEVARIAQLARAQL